MKNSSVLCCEHIHIHSIPGRTDAFVAALQEYLRAMFHSADEVGSAELTICADGLESRFEWLGNVRPASDENAVDSLAAASEIDVRLDLCCNLFTMADAQQALSSILKDGSLKSCVRYCALIEDEQTTSLTLSGLYHGAFLQGSVPFTSDNQDILVETCWNGSSHRAHFEFSESALDDVRDLLDLLEETLEIELILSDGSCTLDIDGVRLNGRNDVRYYRETLEKLARLSQKTLITGSLTPESDAVFALLRFVQEGSVVAVQTAVAEI